MNAFLASFVLSAGFLAAPGADDRPCVTLRINDRPARDRLEDQSQRAAERRTAFTKPADTKINLTLLRDAQPMEVTVVLKELLPVEPAPKETEERPGPVAPAVRDAGGAP